MDDKKVNVNKFYCESCEKKIEVEYECNNCGALYCDKCEEKNMGECELCEPPRLNKLTN